MEASGNVEPVQLSMKLTVHKETNKVLFAEVGKDFADVLISFLTLPLGTIARLVAKEGDMGPVKIASLSSLYESVGNIGDEYMWTGTCKEMLLQPRNPMEDYCRSMKHNVDDTEPTKYYVCNDLFKCLLKPSVKCSTFKNKKCSYGRLLEKEISLKSSICFDGFVQNVSCFMVTDDLCLLPMSLDSSLSIIKKMGIENMSYLDEILVNASENQLIDLLKCSLVSKTPLTDVFIHKKPCPQKSDIKIAYPSGDITDEQCIRMKMKILYQKTDGKILCAHGKENFGNFLLSILTFPLGAVLRMLEGNSSMGSADALYKSVVDLNEDLFHSKEVKAKLVDLGVAPQFNLSNQLLPIYEFKAPEYYCVSDIYYQNHPNDIYLSSEDLKSLNNYCKTQYFRHVNAVDMVDPISESESSKGFVKGPILYAATNDLVVSPISSFSLLSLSNNLHTSLGEIDVKEVSIGLKEVLNILKASLTSSSALTNGLGAGILFQETS
ncbi:unnamed protein product [Lupinus luteus]|uniref:DUF674 family protein n=1 Tax=Lupinus luteus TaxID=3873 RepID=A0AAV1VZS8_LUPLU